MTTETMTTIARPYAVAAFEIALAKHEIPAWETMLKGAALMVQDKAMTRLLTSPIVSIDEIAKFFCEVLSSDLNTERKNFICLLAENKRLDVLPSIQNTFEALRADYEKTITVQVTSAVELDEAYRQKIAAALTKRLQRKVTLECSIDEDLLGGVVARAGDLVLDGSVRGKLNRLIEFI